MSCKPHAHTYHYYPQANINFQKLMSNVGLGFEIGIKDGNTGIRYIEGTPPSISCQTPPGNPPLLQGSEK